MAAALVGVVSSAQATPEDQDAEAVGNAIESYADRLASAADALGEYGDLADSLPLTDLAPGDPGGLNLSNLLDDAVGALGTFASMGALATAIEARDGTYGGVTVQFGAGSFTQPAVTSTATSITIPIHATRTVNQPLDFAFGPVDIAGGSLGVDFVLDTTLTFNVDTNAVTDADTAPATAVSLVPPTIDLCANATGSVGVFTARFGFTDVKVSTDDPNTTDTETATLHACADVVFQDPDSTDGITRDEWTSHALTELATASIVDGAADPANDLDVTFHVDASLIDGDAFVDVEPADASINFTDQNLAVGGFDPTPTPTLGKLDDWDNINAGDVANGLAQFVASLAGSQGESNGPLPFLKKSITETFDAVKPLTDYTSLLTSAQVGCGTVPGGDADSFPTGLTDNLAAGTFVFCRARTSMELDSGSVSWAPPAGVTNVDTTCTECVNEDSDLTLGNGSVTPPGPNPTADAVFKMTSAGNFAIELTWDSDPAAAVATRKAIQRPGTAQELFVKLAAAAGLDTSGGNLSYSSSTKSLSFRLQKENFDPLAVTTSASFGDLLRNATNVAGLQDSGAASFSANISDVDFDVTFGVVLVPDTSDITPLRGTATGSTGTILTDSGANFLTGPNAPRLAQVVKNTTDDTQCTIAAVATTTLTCAAGSVISWDDDDAYDVDGGLADRFYVQVDNAADAAELSVGNLTVGGTLALTGKLGFLEIEAAGDGAKNGFDPGTAFGISKAVGTEPVVRLDIKTPDPFSVDTGASTETISDAIGVADLLFHLDDAHLDAVCNLKATAGLAVSASVDGNPAFAKGGVGVNWPTVFEEDSCKPDFSSLDIEADTDFNLSLKDFDPFPSVSGVHDGGDGDTNLEDTTKNFSLNAVNGENLLQLTLRNETTGASCTITTLDATHLNCSLSGGTRSGDTANNNKWKDGDEYTVEGNVFALLGIILDHLDELVEQVDAIAPGETDKELPLIGISTKELVQKIQSVKQTLDDLRGSPLAAVDCTRNADGTNTGNDNAGRPFDLSILPDNQLVYCRAVSTVEPDAVTWTAKALGTDGELTVGDAVNSLGGMAAGGMLDTVGPSPTARVEITLSDQNGAALDDTLIDEWRAMVEFTDAAGNHTAELPQASPPSSLQELEKLIEDKLGVADPDVFKLDLLDLPDRGDDTPIVSGDHDDDAPFEQASEVLHDDDTDFTSGGAGDPINGNLLVNKTDNLHCTITLVQDNDLTCAGANMQWDDGDDYEVVGNGTKDLIVRLGFGFCSADDAGTGVDALCKDTDRDVDALTVPLNTDLGAAGDLVTLDTEGDLSLDFAARAQLDIGIPLKLDLTPDIAVLDTTKAEVVGRLEANDVGLSASIGPVEVNLGTAVEDIDNDPDNGLQPGTGIAKIGAELSVVKDTSDAGDDALDDAIDNNRTFTIGDFFGDLDVTFQGADPDLECEDPADPDSTGDACGVLHVEVAGIAFEDPLKLACTADPVSCVPMLPPGLQALLDGQALNWGLLLQVLPQLLNKLEGELDGAAKDVSIPLIGDTLDAGANIVGTFNDEVVTPFADLAEQITATVDAEPNGDGDNTPEPWEVAKKVQSFIYDGAGTPFKGLGPGTDGADLILDLNASGDVTIDDVVVTPLCTSSYLPCEPGHELTSIRDLRIAFMLGDDLVDADVPFDIGLRGLPIRMTGGVASDVGWSVFVDFGLNEDGPYMRTSGPKSFAGGETGANGLPGDKDAPAADTAITGTENEAKRPPDIDTAADDEDEATEMDGPDTGPDPDETPDGWAVINYLVDDDATFIGDVEPGMWLWNLDTDEGCRIYSVDDTTLRCDDPGTAANEGKDWHQTAADAGDNYAVIELHPPNEVDGGSSELNLDASVGIGTNAAIDCVDEQHDYPTSGETEPSQLGGFSTTRCLAGELAFLAVTIRDKDTGGDCDDDLTGASEDPTALCLALMLDLTTSDDRVTVSDLLSGDIGLLPQLTGKANVDVRFRTGLNVSQSAGFPSVLGKFHLYWGFVVNTTEGLDLDELAINFDAINLDAGKFISEFLSPIVKQVKKITGPLMPVVELIQGEVPIISDLSKLIGEGPVTVLDVLEAVSGNDLSLLRSILQFIQFVNSIPSDGSLLIPLGSGPGGGSFSVTGERAGGDPPLPDDPLMDQGITPGGGTATNLIDSFAADSDYDTIDDAPDECDPDRGSTFGVCGLTFPFLGNASEIFGVLMGKDATLIRYDAGTFGAGAGFGFCFPPILIGPVPVQICIGGSFRVEGRFAIGYDTSGLRKVLEGGTGTHLLDGIFLDDYNAAGAEVPEVKFIGTVYAEGAVSVYIFKVGIRGEIIFTTQLDLHEDDPQDGKLRIEEIISRLSNPLCLFDVSGKIEAALSAFVEIDLFITSIEFSIEIVRITLLEFDLDVCDPEPPNLARVEGEVLYLHMGSLTERQKRNVAEDEVDELFTVRQMESFTSGPNMGKTRFSITAYGIQEDEFLTTTAVNDGTAELRANADNGDDVLQLLPGSNSGTMSQPNQQNPPVPFRLDAVITGGSGADEITSGDGNDDVRGGSEDDRLITGVRADLIRGDGGNDKIDAGDGDDVDVQGGAGDDNVNGGKGGDTLEGNGGNDVVSAGPDNAAATDELRGGDGSDTLTADLGDDKLYGDEILDFDCSSDGSDTGAADTGPGGDNSDALIGGDGNDLMHGGAEEDQLDAGNGNDTACGGGGRDEISGGAGKDIVEGGGGDDNIVGGTDNSPIADGGDILNGDAGRDYILGDEGTLTRDQNSNVVTVALAGAFAGNDTINGGSGDDFLWGQGGLDAMNGDGNDDEMRGGPGVDTMNGNASDDEMYGEDANDVMHGNTGNDYMRGGLGSDTMDGDEATDEMYGDNDVDVMRGGAADDLMRGGSGDDDMEGNENGSNALTLDDDDNPFAEVNFDLHLLENPATGAWTPQDGGDGDVMFGDADQDDIIGGSRGATPPADGGDTIFGNHAQDVIAGDNADIKRPGDSGCAAVPATDPDGTTRRCVTLTDPGADGGAVGDFIRGNDENDDVYAGGDGDLVHGDQGDDYVEGNGGDDGDGDADTTPDSAIGLYGDIGQDDLIGGTNQGDGGVADGADDAWGGQGHDVIAGDNADITRAAGSDCPAGFSQGYECNTFRLSNAADVVIRRIQIWDVDTTTTDPVAGTSDGDTIGGEDDHDRLYGQGGDDSIEGGPKDDFAFGNAGADTINGGDGQDDLVGGTGRIDSATPSSATDGRIDANDVIQGEADFDAISGDNARIVRQTQDGDTGDTPDDTGFWKANTFNNAVDRVIALMDVATTTDDAPLTNGTSGNDELLGGDADDVVYGQGGNDGISGGNDQDLLEGNANGTGDAPDPADTYGVGVWPVFAGDVIHGDAGADDAGGGTGRIYRMVAGVEMQDPPSGVDGRKDGGDTIFGDEGGDALAGDNTVIERALEGGQWILDDLRDPDALDVVRRVTRERDVATTTNLAPLTNGTSGGDVIYGNEGVDVAYGQGGDDQIQGNANDDHLEGNANDDTIQGNEGQDDVIGGTGRTFSNDEATAVAGRIDNPTGDDAPNDALHGGDGAGGVATGDDDFVAGDNATIDRELGSPIPTVGKLPFNGTWQPASWDEPAILRVVRLLDVATTANTAPETDGTNGDDTINGEANEDVVFGQGGNDTINGDDADLLVASAADANPGDDYIEGNGATDTIRGDLRDDDVTGGGSASSGVLDANRDGRLDDNRSGETLRDAGDVLVGDSGDGTLGDNDVIAGDNARIQRLLDGSGDWRLDGQRKDIDAETGAKLRDVFLFDIELVGAGEPGDAAAGESGVDTITGNGGEDILLGQANGAVNDAYGNETGAGAANCQNATGGPGSGTISGTEEAPNGDDDNDDLPDLNDPQCRVAAPGDTLSGETGEDYIEGNQGSDNATGGEGEDDVVGGSSANTGHLNAILPPSFRDAGFAPGAIGDSGVPFNLLDGHDVIEGNAEDDTVLGDNAFVDRYLAPTTGDWITIAGAGHAGSGELPVPNPEPAKAPFEVSDLVRRDVTTKATTESAGAFGNDYVRGGVGQDDVYGTLGNDWLEGNENEDAIVGDMGKVVNNVLGVDDAIDPPDPPQQFIVPNQPFLGATINQTGVLKREVTLYAFNQLDSPNTAGIGHDVALGGDGNDWIHTGPGEDLANGNAGDDRIFLGDNFTAITAKKTASQSLLAHDRVDAGWGGLGYDHVWGGYGADYSDVRPRKLAEVPGLFPTSDPETWYQVAGAGPTVGFPPPAPQELSHNGVNYAHGDDNFGYKDYHYGGWDQDTLQANVGDNGPHIGDRLLDWGGSYNGYYLCPSTYGDWVSTRALAPGVIAFLQAMSQGDGATTTATDGTSGFRETAIVFTNQQKDNTKPIHADTPAHFTCGPGTATP